MKAIFPNLDVAKRVVFARTKITSIVTGVLAPYAQKKLLFNLGTRPFSISVDASNYNRSETIFTCYQAIQTISTIETISTCYQANVGVNVCLLDRCSMPGETSKQIMSFILSSMEEKKLDVQQLTSFCADNAPVNFGGSNQGGKNNVFFHLWQQKTYLIPVGCPGHILHNAADKGAERLTVDIETIVLKIGCQTRRTNSLKQFCEQLDANYSTLPTYTPTR